MQQVPLKNFKIVKKIVGFCYGSMLAKD